MQCYYVSMNVNPSRDDLHIAYCNIDDGDVCYYRIINTKDKTAQLFERWNKWKLIIPCDDIVNIIIHDIVQFCKNTQFDITSCNCTLQPNFDIKLINYVDRLRIIDVNIKYRTNGDYIDLNVVDRHLKILSDIDIKICDYTNIADYINGILDTFEKSDRFKNYV